MILTQKHRSSIYAGLSPVIGDEEAEALLSQFPTRVGDEPVTRDVLRAELAEFRSEMHMELGQIHDQMRQMAMWMVGATITGLVGGMGVAVAVGTALG